MIFDFLRHLAEAQQRDIPLVIDVGSADTMASLIKLKKEIETYYDTTIRMTFTGAAESHLLAKEIGEAGKRKNGYG